MPAKRAQTGNMKTGHDRIVRVDFHGAKEIPTGTCDAILKAAGIKKER